MTWNIWHGGLHGDASSDFAQDTINTENVYKVLKEEQPDILLMQETYCCGMDMAKKAGYEYSWRGSSNLSIHSKYPIIDTIHLFKPFNSHGAVIEIDGDNVLVFNIWLDWQPDTFQTIKSLPADSLIMGEEETRLKEIKEILRSVDSLQSDYKLPVIIGGDFNSASHLDWVESTKNQHYGKVVEWPVSKWMETNGFLDSFREVHPDPNISLDGTWGYLDESIISDRIDFIFSKGSELSVLDSKIVMDDPEGGFFNSDHRGILTKFQLEK